MKHPCQIGCIKFWDRYPVLSMFSNAIDLSCILLEVEFAVLASPVIALVDCLFDKVECNSGSRDSALSPHDCLIGNSVNLLCSVFFLKMLVSFESKCV